MNDHKPRQLTYLDFDFESKPWWFWYEKPTAVITSLSWMYIDGSEIDHNSLKTMIAPLTTREQYRLWLQGVVRRFSEADILTGHNIDRFDLPLLQAQLLRLGEPALPSLVTQDTMRLPKKRDMSGSQESLVNYYDLKPICPIGMPVYKHHLSIPEWEDAAMGWDEKGVLTERPQSDVHSHAHMRELLIEKGYLGAPKPWSPRRAK